MATPSLRNWIPAAILSSPLHPVMSRRSLLLSFTGRRSGVRYVTPVNYLQRDRELLITTKGGWWRNFDGGVPVELRLRGRRVAAVAEAVREPAVVAEALTALVRDHRAYGRWAQVRVGADGTPDTADVHAAIASGRVLVRVLLDGETITP
ncbi:nitroreductase/quinone reductase family protein [Streptosporangium sp. LJ11]|uniref:nitroreductase/quinone reductase family protein n=1 Tax=Streptosporangium sp. LJ11 TaxID=3436927 RepID=UPI003F78F487